MYRKLAQRARARALSLCLQSAPLLRAAYSFWYLDTWPARKALVSPFSRGGANEIQLVGPFFVDPEEGA